MTAPSVSTYNFPTYMVSNPPPTDRALTTRRPSSISSRSTATRRHRNSRSHHGGSSLRPQNEFPNFAQTGDVEIIIHADGQEKRYMLHRLILAQCSGFFEAGTSEDWSKAQAWTQTPGTVPKNGDGLASIGEEEEVYGREMIRPGPSSIQTGDRPRWRYELDWGNKDDEVPMLVQRAPTLSLFGGDHTPRPPPVPNKPPAPPSGFFRSMANFSAMQSASHIPHSNPQVNADNEIIRDYDNLFRIFYNYPPTLDCVNIAETYIQCKTLLALADMYDSLEVVGPRIDHHLLQFQSRLWKQIAKYPPSYLKLGYLARSKVIFSEALVHVVGQWPSGSTQLRNSVPDSVLDLIEDKVEELQEKRTKAEMRLFRLSLATTRGDRVTPQNSYLDWLALSLFRQWLAENTTPPPPPIPKSSNTDPRRLPASQPLPMSAGTLYRLLGTGGSSYLAHDELKRFIRIRPEEYSRDTLKKFEKRMNEIKEIAREIVKPLMRSYLELDVGREGAGSLGYLTCTRVEEGDFPWEE